MQEQIFYKAIRVTIDCEENDPVDIAIGGPHYLGFDFNIDVDEYNDAFEEFIKKTLKKYKRPLMAYSTVNFSVPEKDHLWTKKKIEECIKKGYE